MAIVNLYSGGARTANPQFAMMPAAPLVTGVNAVAGYADHQRRRSYAVVRQMRFGPSVPYGGEGAKAGTDLKDWDWYSTLVAGGGNVAVADVWNLLIIPPNTRVEYITAWVFAGLAGVGFTVSLLNATTGAVIGTAPETILALGAATMTDPVQVPILAASQSSTSARFVGITFTAVPATAGVLKLQGLNFAVQAEVVDWGSWDLNGNA